MGHLLKSAGRGFASILFPPACPVCDRRVEGASVPCPDCDAGLRTLWEEAASLPAVDGLIASLPFTGAARTLIHRMKYQGHRPAADVLGLLMAASLRSSSCVPHGTCLIPVPLHPTRLRERGFNQAERLARVIARESGLPIQAGLIQRVRFARSQTLLTIEARRRSVAGAFRLRRLPPPACRRPILVDDVWTTGATLEACCHVLEEGGIEPPIPICVAARTPAFLKSEGSKEGPGPSPPSDPQGGQGSASG